MKTQIFTRIFCIKRSFQGLKPRKSKDTSVELFRFDLKEEVEFMTIMTFDSLENVISLQGKDYKKSYVPESARKLLKRWDQVAVHYTAVEKRKYRL